MFSPRVMRYGGAAIVANALLFIQDQNCDVTAVNLKLRLGRRMYAAERTSLKNTLTAMGYGNADENQLSLLLQQSGGDVEGAVIHVVNHGNVEVAVNHLSLPSAPAATASAIPGSSAAHSSSSATCRLGDRGDHDTNLLENARLPKVLMLEDVEGPDLLKLMKLFGMAGGQGSDNAGYNLLVPTVANDNYNDMSVVELRENNITFVANMSPAHNVTLEKGKGFEALQLHASVSKDSEGKFAWMYPINITEHPSHLTQDGALEKLASHRPALKKLFKLGGYVYFSKFKEVVAVRAVSDTKDSLLVADSSAAGARELPLSKSIMSGEKYQKYSAEAMAKAFRKCIYEGPIAKMGRAQPVTLPALNFISNTRGQAAAPKHFAWINPGEFWVSTSEGDVDLMPDGGFFYSASEKGVTAQPNPLDFVNIVDGGRYKMLKTLEFTDGFISPLSLRSVDHDRTSVDGLYKLTYNDRKLTLKLGSTESESPFAIVTSKDEIITLSDAEKREVGIPGDALSFHFAYPINLEDDSHAPLARFIANGRQSEDSNLKFMLKNGAYVYLNARDEIVGIKAISGDVSADGLAFGQARPVHSDILNAIDSQSGRWQLTTLQSLRDIGVNRFTWVLPYEQIGNSEFQLDAEHGAFLYDIDVTIFAEKGGNAMISELISALAAGGDIIMQRIKARRLQGSEIVSALAQSNQGRIGVYFPKVLLSQLMAEIENKDRTQKRIFTGSHTSTAAAADSTEKMWFLSLEEHKKRSEKFREALLQKRAAIEKEVASLDRVAESCVICLREVHEIRADIDDSEAQIDTVLFNRSGNPCGGGHHTFCQACVEEMFRQPGQVKKCPFNCGTMTGYRRMSSDEKAAHDKKLMEDRREQIRLAMVRVNDRLRLSA